MIGLLETIVGAPFVAAALLLLIPAQQKTALRVVSAVAALISLAGSIQVWRLYDLAKGGLQLGVSYPVLPDLGIHLKLAVDGWGVSLLLLTGLIITGGVFASWTLEDRPKEFFVFLLVLVAGVFGVFVCQDLFLFFLFYEIAVLPMYLLIGIWGSSNKVAEAGPFRVVWKMFDVGGKEYAAMKLTLMLLVGSALILAVMLAMYHSAGAGTFDMQVLGDQDYPMWLQSIGFLALWVGFGTLAGLWPFHTWSPDGHAAAPTAVSMLHAGVLMKLGAFGVMRVGMMMLPEGAREWAWLVGLVAVINIFHGAMCALAQKDLKYIIAYSSVSHMGVVLLGAATLTVNGWNGAVYQNAHTRWIPSMGGFGRVMPGVATFFTLGAMSSLGLPALAGFVAEALVFIGAWESAHSWWALVGLVGAWITAIYVLRGCKGIFWGEGPSEEFTDLKDAQGVEWVALWLLGLGLIVFGCAPRLILDFIDLSTAEYLAQVLGSAWEGIK